MKQGSANAALPCFLLIKLFHPPLVSHSILKIIKPNKPKSDAGSGNGAGVDSAWEQKKLEARKMLENAAASPASSARFVSPRLCLSRL